LRFSELTPIVQTNDNSVVHHHFDVAYPSGRRHIDWHPNDRLQWGNRPWPWYRKSVRLRGRTFKKEFV